MTRIADIVCMLCLGIIIWQDLRTRTISWWTLPPLAAGFFLSSLSHAHPEDILMNTFINFVLLTLHFLLLWTWFVLKKRRFVPLINSFIGIGDILFFLCLAFGFSTPNFLLVYTFSLVIAIVLAMLARFFFGNTRKTIPLAGYVATPMMILCTLQFITPSHDFYNSTWISSMLGRII